MTHWRLDLGNPASRRSLSRPGFQLTVSGSATFDALEDARQLSAACTALPRQLAETPTHASHARLLRGQGPLDHDLQLRGWQHPSYVDQGALHARDRDASDATHIDGRQLAR